MKEYQVGVVSIIVLAVSLGVLGYFSYVANNGILEDPTTGITVLHDGHPVTNLSVQAFRTYLGNPKDTPYFTAPTDASGTMSFHPGIWASAIYGWQYQFLFNAKTFAVTGTPGQITTVTV